MLRIGIDLGGTKTEVLALDQQGGELFRERVATPKNDYAGTLQAITDLVHAAEREVNQQCSVGICTPGSLSPDTHLLRNSNSTCLNQKPFKQDIEKLLSREVRISNDANCFALSEATDGAAEGAQIVFGVIIGTGCGGGIVINHQVINGPNSISGEWGHTALPWPEEDEVNSTTCWCGQQNCLETFLSGSGIERDYYCSYGEQRSSVEIFQAKDECAMQIVSRYEQRLAKSLAMIVNIIDPHVIVLGGGVSNVTDLYEKVPTLWGKYIFSDGIHTQLRPPKYGDSSGIRGAAWLWNK